MNLDPNIRGAIPARISDFVSQSRTIGLVSKIDAEFSIKRQTAFLCVNMNHQKHWTFSKIEISKG